MEAVMEGMMDENIGTSHLKDVAFPEGYKGLPTETVDKAEAHCDWAGVTDPIKRRIEALSWSMDTIRNETPKYLEMPDFYWEVRKEKYKLMKKLHRIRPLPLRFPVGS